ncbi:MAG: hypothetical protein GF353_05015 [Candidatus Lokiarchaeota archaeon]|nr:hypothetical protein [Candidatus Lokiarchaeota archaeon]
MKTIISPVGLSLINNFFKGKSKGGGECKGLEGYRDDLNEAGSAKNYGAYLIENAREALKSDILAWAEKTENACAEFTSIKKLEEKFPDEEFEIHLLPSDTVLSKFMAEIISDIRLWKNHLNRVTQIIQEHHIEGLQVEDENDFIQIGMKSLTRKIEDFLDKVPDPQTNLLLNITGGYKATIPYLTIWGQIYGIQLFYTFEDTLKKSNQLIKIPQAPIDFDFTILDDYYDTVKILKNKSGYKFDDFKQELIKKGLKYNLKDITNLTESNILEKDEKKNEINLSLIGDIFLRRFENLRSKGIRNAYSNLFGNIIELKVFKFYAEKYSSTEVQHSITFWENKQKMLELDVFIESKNFVTAVEVKPLNGFKEIKSKFEENKFDYLLSKYSDKSVKLEFILYSHAEIPDSVLDQITELQSANQNKFKEIIWKRLDLNIGDPQKKIQWKVDNNKFKGII